MIIHRSLFALLSQEYYDVERADVNGGVSDFTNQESEVKSCFSHWVCELFLKTDLNLCLILI